MQPSCQFMGATIESNSFITRVNKQKIWEAVLDEKDYLAKIYFHFRHLVTIIKTISCATGLLACVLRLKLSKYRAMRYPHVLGLHTHARLPIIAQRGSPRVCLSDCNATNQMIYYRQHGVIILNWSEMVSHGVVRLIFL